MKNHGSTALKLKAAVASTFLVVGSTAFAAEGDPVVPNS